MSAILPGAPNDTTALNGSLGPDGIRRYKTRCKILVDSHNAGSGQDDARTIEIIDDVFSAETSKTIKGPGQATVSLIPSQNYMNLIFPNDYINIYFDIGDGSGWTRTFFGFVDRVEESYEVSQSGEPKTHYRLVCTDFYKAFERTMIYFNPQLFGREDFNAYDFAAPNIGGLALMTKGIIVGGSPPDIITNIILLLLGFGTQFSLPPSYSPGDTQKRLREERAGLVYGKLSPEAQETLNSIGGNYQKLRDEINAEASLTVSSFRAGGSQDESQRIQNLAQSLNVNFDELEAKTDDELARLLADQKLRDTLTVAETERGVAGTTASASSRAINILDSTISDKSSLIDIIDTFSFVERRAIDGYIVGKPVWQRQGSLISILRSFSNECVNEMFFDLRPLSSSGNDGAISSDPVEGQYARVLDDKRGNNSDSEGTPVGITYIPALVMREYPFSTIEGLNLDEVELQLKNEQGEPETIGVLYFGAIFSDKPNVPGRHVVSIKNINIAEKVEGRPTQDALKQLDVAVVSEQEIVKTNLGRSDNDHFNLFEFYSESILGTDQRFYMRDILPVITPIHILRNGIRVRSVTTRAARFSLEAVRNLEPETAPEPTSPQETEDTEELPLVPQSASSIQAPVDSDPDVVRYYDSNAQARWGYRPKSPIQSWAFHQGIDISKRPLNLIPDDKVNEPIPIRAIADGWIVISAPSGCYEGYGNVVVIKHNFENVGIRYSVYSHLSSRSKGFLTSQATGTRGNRTNFAADGEAPGIRFGTKPVLPVKKGEIIGFMGNTGFTAAPGTRFHLHFEIDRHFPPRNDAVTPRIPFTEIPQTDPTPPPPSGFDTSGSSTSTMRAARQNSANPMDFYSNVFGLNLQQLINNGDPTFEDLETEPEEIDLGSGDAEETTQNPRRDVESETGVQLLETPEPIFTVRAAVDTASSRSQIIRWALLQDHWYQHNLEYLSGRVDMRGAPEIRVGYRLDILDRRMSFYVEGVNHSWTFPSNMNTNLQVSRGQPNNPYPLYVFPAYKQMGATDTQRRTAKSRLATYFVTPDPVAIRRSLFIRNGNTEDAGLLTNLLGTGSDTINETDNIEDVEFDTDSRIAQKYNERVSPAGSSEITRRMEEDSFTETTTEESDSSRLDPLAGPDSRGGINIEDPIENR